MSSQSTVDGDAVSRLLLSIGFLAVAGSALVAHAAPATGYELSPYTMTPSLVWAGLLVAASVSLAVSFVATDRTGRALALVLGGLAMTTFVGLPIVRGYRFYGQYDALTHLGWARAVGEGTVLPFDLFYPGIHTVTALVDATVGTSLSHSMLLVVLLFVLAFWVFVPLSVGAIVRDRRAVIVAAFSAFLLLPITTISTFLSAHAMSQAVLFSSVLVYLFVSHLRSGRATAPASAIGVAFALASAGALVYHPQLVAHLIAAFLGICAVQFLARRIAADGRIAGQTPVYGQTLFLVVLFLAWASNYGFFAGMVEYFLGSAAEFFLGDGGAAGDTVATQGASLSAIGGGLAEIFLKLFLAQLVFSLLAGGLALGALVSRNSRWFDDVRAEAIYFSVALAALVPVFGVYFFAPGSSMYFRVFGLMMVFVTILGAIAIHGLSARFSSRAATAGRFASGRPLLTVAFAFLLVVSLAAVFPSPYTYKASPHVTDATMTGYETAFDNRDDDVAFLGLRDGPNRYDDAINGNEERSSRHGGVSASELGSGVAGQYDEDRYLALTRADYEREVVAYRGLRYTEADLDAVSVAPGVNRVQSNGEFDLYYVRGDAE